MHTSHLVLLVAITAFGACRQLDTHRPACAVHAPIIPQDTSHLSTPLIIPTRLIEDKMNRAIKQEIVRDDSFDNLSRHTGKKDKLKLSVNRLGNIDVTWKDNVVTYQAPLLVLIERQIISKKVLPMPKALALKTQFSVRLVFETRLEVGSDWRLQPTTKFKNFEWLSEVTALGGLINLKKMVEKRIRRQMPEIEADMDRGIREKIRLDRVAKRIWLNVQKPIVLGRKERVMWLKINPLRLDLGKISTSGGNLLVQTRLLATTETLFGEFPDYRVDSLLPPLRKYAALPNDAFVYLLAELPYNGISDLLNRKLAGKSFDVQGRKIRIKAVSVEGCGNDLVVHLTIGGAVRGEIYLQGKPEYETNTHGIAIRNFDFEVHTEEALIAGADWLLHSTFKEKIQAELQLPLAEKMEMLPANIVRDIEKGRLGEKINFQIEQWAFEPQRIWVREHDLAVLVIVRAQVKLALEKI